MKLRHTLILGTLVHMLDGFGSLPAKAQAAPAPAPSQWDYIVDSEDGALYFGRNIRTYEGMTFIDMKTEADPAGRNGDEYSWTSVFRCDAKTFKSVSGDWEPVQTDTVGEEWMKYACKGVGSISGKKTVTA